MNILKVIQLKSTSGVPVKNQFIITTPEGMYFQSYDSMIVFRPYNHRGEKTILDPQYWRFSTTTSKYRSMFLSESAAETQKKIDSGEYILQDLNNGR